MTTIGLNVNGSLTATNITDSGLTNNTALTANGSNQLTSSSTTATELGYVHGVTSGIQAQINAIVAGSFDIVSGTTITTGYSAGQVVTSNGTVVGALSYTTAQTASTLVERDSNNNINVISTTATSATVGSGVQFNTQGNVHTPAAAVTPIVTLTVPNSCVWGARVLITFVDLTNVGSSGVISYAVKANSGSAGVLSISSLADYTTIIDTADLACTSTVTGAVANTIVINVTGIAATNIDWFCSVQSMTQT